MAWSLIATGAGVVGANVVSISMSGAAPSGSGGILLLTITCRTAPTTVSTPSGWVKLVDNVLGISLMARLSDGGADDTPSITMTGVPQTTLGVLTRWTGGQTDLAQLLHGTVQQDSGTTIDYIPLAAITPTVDGCLVLRLGMQDNDSGPASAYPGTLLVDQNMDVANDMWAAQVYEIQSSAATVAAGQIDNTSNQTLTGRSVTVALLPAPTTVTRYVNPDSVGGTGETANLTGAYAEDDFNRADESPLAGNWTTGWGAGLAISGNAVHQVSAAGVTAAFWNYTAYSAEQFSAVDYTALSSFDYAGVGVRLATTGGGRGYTARWGNGDHARLLLLKVTAGAETSLATLDYALAVNDRVRLTAKTVGANCVLTVQLRRNGHWTTLLTYTDTSSPYTDGQPGLCYDWQNTNGTYIDNWQGGECGDAAYASLQAALDAERGNLVAANERLELICATNGSADTVRVNQDVAGWTTDATRYVHIKPAAGHRAGTQWDTGKYRISVPYTSGGTAGQFLICGAAGGPLFVRVEGLQIEATIDSIDSPTRRIMPVVMSPAEAGGGADCRMFGCYVRISGTRALDFTSAESWHGILTNPNTVSPATAPNLYIYNNIVELDVTVTALPSASAAIRGENRRHNLYAYNNTIIGPWVNAFSGSEDSNRLHYLKNNLASGISGNFVSGTYVNTKCDYNATTAAAMGYTAGSNDRVSQTFTFAAPHNFLLLDEDTGAKDHGLVDPGSGLFSTDITGYARPTALEAIFGYDGIGWTYLDDGNQHTGGADMYRQITAARSGIVTQVSIYIPDWGTADTLSVALYTTSGSLIAESATISSAGGTGLRTASIAASVEAGTDYLLVVMVNSGYVSLRKKSGGVAWQTFSQLIGAPGSAPASFTPDFLLSSSEGFEFIAYLSGVPWDIGAYEYRVLTEPTHLTTNEYGTGYDFGPGPLVSCTNSVDTGSGANRCILVQHMRRSDRAIEIQSVTIGGESMVVLGSDISLIDLYVVRTFALVNPTVEGMQDLVITCTTNDSLSVASTIVAVYDGVDPNASEAALLALADSETVVTPYSSPYTFAVPSQTGHLAMLFAFAGSDDVSYSLTAAGGFNERIRDTAGQFVHRTGDQPGKTSADFTWTPGFLSQNLTIVGHGFSLPPVPADDGFVARLLIRNYLPLLVR